MNPQSGQESVTELIRRRDNLEELARERAAELLRANEALQKEVAERLRTEEQLRAVIAELRRSNQELETFAYVASHDLQEPLRLVASHTQLLMLKYYEKLDEEAQPIADSVIEGVNRMRALILGLLAYSRVGARPNELGKTSMESVFERAVSSLSMVIKETGAEVARGELPTIRADGARVEQLLQNLLANALKFRREGVKPVIRVSARKREDGEDWEFVVEDNGIGIAPEYFEKIFVIFQRLHSRRHYEGTGIGLSICKRIIERHGGRIWVESQPGRGSRFFFTIPFEPATEFAAR